MIIIQIIIADLRLGRRAAGDPGGDAEGEAPRSYQTICFVVLVCVVFVSLYLYVFLFLFGGKDKQTTLEQSVTEGRIQTPNRRERLLELTN